MSCDNRQKDKNSADPHERNNISRELLGTIKKRIAETTNHENLQLVATGNISREQFQDFSINHYHSGSEWFMKLLTDGSQKLRAIGCIELADEFEHNYNDEEGIINGVSDIELNHETWRQRYGRALGVEPEKTIASKKVKQSIIDPSLKALEERSPIFHAAWLAATEWYTTMEFMQIKKGRDILFPEKFVIAETDDEQTKKDKHLDSQYINDHISHDISHTTNVLLPLAEIILESSKSGGILHGYNVKNEINDAIEFVVKCQRDFLQCSLDPVNLSLTNSFAQNTALAGNNANSVSGFNPKRDCNLKLNSFEPFDKSKLGTIGI